MQLQAYTIRVRNSPHFTFTRSIACHFRYWFHYFTRSPDPRLSTCLAGSATRLLLDLHQPNRPMTQHINPWLVYPRLEMDNQKGCRRAESSTCWNQNLPACFSNIRKLQCILFTPLLNAYPMGIHKGKATRDVKVSQSTGSLSRAGKSLALA